MKRVIPFVLLSGLIFGLSLARGDEKEDAAVSELKKLDAKLTEAFKEHDAKTIDKHTADDYFEIDPLGRAHSKKHLLEHVEKSTAKLSDAKETSVHVRHYGDTAVVTGILNLKGSVGEKDISGEYRWTRVYHKQDGEWKVIVEQHTYVVPKDAKD
jgi:ketosteroid isomerase-like protein